MDGCDFGSTGTELLEGVAWKMEEPLVMAQTWPVCRKGPLQSDHSTAPPWGPHISCCSFIHTLSRSVRANRTGESEKARTSPWSPGCALLDIICKYSPRAVPGHAGLPPSQRRKINV